MNNKRAVLAIASVVILSSSVMAQEIPNPSFAFRAGLGYLLNRDARDLTKSSGLTLGASYYLPATFLQSADAGFRVDFDWNRVSGNGNRIDSYGLSLVATHPFGSAKKAGVPVPYFGLGLGASYNDVRGSELVSGGGSSGGTVRRDTKDTGVRLSGKALVGIDFGGRFFVEGSYNLNGSTGGTRADTLGIQVGIKF